MSRKADVTLRTDSNDPIPFQLLSSGTAIDLTGATYVQLLLKDTVTASITSFRTDTATANLFVTTASTGTIEFRPSTATFDTETSFDFYFNINDSAGKTIPVPEEIENFWRVRFKYT